MRIRARLITKNYELEERRKKLGYSQQDFADIVGIPINVYQRIEQIKQKPTEEQAVSMALELKVSKDILFPQGYEKIIDIFNTQFERIADYTPPLLQVDEQLLLEQADARFTVGKMLKDLPERERNLIEMRYGLKDKEPKTLDEVARNMGVTRERIRQIEAKAHELIRSKYKAEQL